MISRRLTKTQKAEILEAYRSGDNTNSLAEKFNCTTNTINRTVKTLLTENEYSILKKQRLRMNNKKVELVDKQVLDDKQKELNKDIQEDDNIYIKENDGDSSYLKTGSDYVSFDSQSQNICGSKESINNIENNFEEIEPLITNFDFDIDKQKSNFEILNYESLPESVYMIVDKKVELDMQSIEDLPEWNFLPENELKRNAILLFTNQRSAKRSCSRNQRVIKIPNTDVFKISKPYLISKGITRLILEDSIIALDN
tara:strand:+ start:358 stop:1122 length:765 start_codon:yes stop_codon:yes gene_type:complete